MNTSLNKYDAIENLIFSEGLRISSLDFENETGTMFVHLNNSLTFIIPVGFYKRLKGVSTRQLMHYELIGGGTGIHWPELDEDLSLKGFLKEYLRQRVNTEKELFIA